MENPSPSRTVRFDEPPKQLPEIVTEVEGSADFEGAIAACGYGKFHYLLLLVTLLSTWGVSYDTSNTAYLLPSAECDLQLTHFDKGMLNAAVYLGMLGSAYLWGFLADTTGRYRLLVVGTVIDTLCNLAASFSQSFWFLLLLKSIGGFITCGPMVVLPPYLAEFHSEKHRPQAMLIQGLFVALAQLTVPMLAWVVIPLPWEWSWTVYGVLIKFNTWRLFLLICLVPGLLSALFLYFYFEESPKFLMASGRHEEALEVFRRVYTINTGKSPDTFPVKVLRVGHEEGDGILTLKGGNQKSAVELLKIGIKQAKPLFVFPLLPWALMVYSLQFGTLLGVNTLRLWIPQLFATMAEFTNYQAQNNRTNISASLCEMLSFKESEFGLDSVEVEGSKHCSGDAMLEDAVYLNSMIVAAVCAVAIVSVSFIIKTVGKKNVLVYCFFIGGVTALSIVWSRSTAATLTLSSIYVASVATCGVAVLSVTVDIFPTALRTMAVSLLMMAGEMGATIGNMLFPVFLDINCILPFLLLGGTTLVCGGLSLLLPANKKKEDSC